MWRASSKLSGMHRLTHWALVWAVAWRRLTLVPEGQVGRRSLGGKKLWRCSQPVVATARSAAVKSSRRLSSSANYVSFRRHRLESPKDRDRVCRVVAWAWRVVTEGKGGRGEKKRTEVMRVLEKMNGRGRAVVRWQCNFHYRTHKVRGAEGWREKKRS
jgi:hypothetical protein